MLLLLLHLLLLCLLLFARGLQQQVQEVVLLSTEGPLREKYLRGEAPPQQGLCNLLLLLLLGRWDSQRPLLAALRQ